MRKVITYLFVVTLLNAPALWSQSAPSASSSSDTNELRQELEQLKKTVAALEAKLASQEKQSSGSTETATTATEPTVAVKDLDERVAKAEKRSALDRLNWSGDFRFQAHTYTSTIPNHFDGMQLQNLLVKTMFYMQTNGIPPASVSDIQNNVAARYSDYQYFTNNLTFAQLKAAMGQIPSGMQQQLMQMLMPSTYVPGYSDDNKIMYTNRLRLNLDAQVADNVSFTGRLSMYKVFGDSTGVQMFAGQPTQLAIDGVTTRVPNSDIVRVERAYFTWNKIADSPLYISIGRRPSTEGPPMNYRNDEMRAGTPSGGLIDYQFDGITVGYHIGEKVALRACYGLGYESGFGNGNALKLPADRLKDVHFFGGNFDLYTTDKTLIQSTIARAWNVTDGFNGEMVLPNNPVTGDQIGAPVIMRYTPGYNLGAINLYGVNLTRRQGPFDLYSSFNWNGTRPNGETSPFGGLMSDPFEAPENHEGHMILLGARFNLPQNDGRTKFGFEFNQGSKYWFNFAQAEDDILAPKTSTRGEVYETYLTHRIRDRFIFKASYLRYNPTYSGSGWHVGAPKRLASTPVLGFPTFDVANMFTMGLTARF
jgi:Protein of unknown function (DUF3373)